MVQAWYQGGISVLDFTNPARPQEIAFFDRGPLDPARLTLAGHWSAYWYNGRIVASEIARGLDILELEPSAFLSANEIAAATLVQATQVNPQLQTRITWPAHPAVARAYVDQLERGEALAAARIAALRTGIDEAEGLTGAPRRAAFTALAAAADRDAAGAGDPPKVRQLAAALRALAR
jgi:hypothetical protein